MYYPPEDCQIRRLWRRLPAGMLRKSTCAFPFLKPYDALIFLLLQYLSNHIQICMSNFSTNDLIVATECDHVFHKGCCQEWLKQARTCPVCRTDIPVSLGMGEDGEDSVPNASSFEDGLPIFRARGPFRSSEVLQDLENLVSLLRETNNRG